MKLTIAVILVAALAAITATISHADKNFNPTCGNNPGKYAYAFDISHSADWRVEWNQNCGTGGTVEYEVQHTTDGGLHWNDNSDSLYTTPGDRANLDTSIVKHIAGLGCSASGLYRLHIWSASGDSVTPGYQCIP